MTLLTNQDLWIIWSFLYLRLSNIIYFGSNQKVSNYTTVNPFYNLVLKKSTYTIRFSQEHHLLSLKNVSYDTMLPSSDTSCLFLQLVASTTSTTTLLINLFIHSFKDQSFPCHEFYFFAFFIYKQLCFNIKHTFIYFQMNPEVNNFLLCICTCLSYKRVYQSQTKLQNIHRYGHTFHHFQPFCNE